MVTASRFRSFSSQSFCWLCEATQTQPLGFCDFSDDAPHRGTLLDLQSYIAACEADKAQPSTLFNWPGFCLHHIAVISMHAGDIGVFQDAVGPLFRREVSNKKWHRTRQLSCVWLSEQLNMFYSGNPDLARLTLLKLSQLASWGKAGGVACPKLRAEGAMTRHAAEFSRILAFMHRMRPGAVGRSCSERGTLQGARRSTEVLAQHHRWCSAAPFQPKHCMVCLKSKAALHGMCCEGAPEAEQASLPWKLRPKAHMLQSWVSDRL